MQEPSDIARVRARVDRNLPVAPADALALALHDTIAALGRLDTKVEQMGQEIDLLRDKLTELEFPLNG